jgi:hypothetical protein
MFCSVQEYGGAVYIENEILIVMTKCLFVSNTGGKSEGGNDVYIEPTTRNLDYGKDNFVDCCSNSTSPSFYQVFPFISIFYYSFVNIFISSIPLKGWR